MFVTVLLEHTYFYVNRGSDEINELIIWDCVVQWISNNFAPFCKFL